jgi:uncharacterized protein YbjT (DUF2867 family)
MITIIGATGRIGRHLVELLLDRGETVKAVSRYSSHLESFIVRGAIPAVLDMNDIQKLSYELEGSQSVFVSIPFLPRQENYRRFANQMNTTIALALQEANIPHVINLSSIGAHLPGGDGVIKTYYDIEQRLNTLPHLNLVHLRIPFLMENFFGAVQVIRHWGSLRAMIQPDHQIPLIAARDVAAVAADHLLNCSVGGVQVVTVPATDNLTMQDCARTIAEAAGLPGLAYIPFTSDEYRDWLLEAGFSRQMVSLLSEMQDSINRETLYTETPIVSDHSSSRVSFTEFARRLAPFLQKTSVSETAG